MNSTKRVVMNNFDGHIVISELETSNHIDHIPAQIYHARLTPSQDLVLVKERAAFEVPVVQYAPHPRYRDAITGAYDREGPALGVLLEGAKGSGKSLLAEDIANWALKQDIPVISVDCRMPVQFLRMIYSAVGPHVLLIDEFDKLYMVDKDDEDKDAEQLLNFFSDNSNRGLLTVLTMNKTSPTLYQDRPQRFNFRIVFSSYVSAETVEQVLQRYNVQEPYASLISEAATGVGWNIDCLQCVAKSAATATSVGDWLEAMEIVNIPNITLEAPSAVYTIPQEGIPPVIISRAGYQMSTSTLTVTLAGGEEFSVQRGRNGGHVILDGGAIIHIHSTSCRLRSRRTWENMRPLDIQATQTNKEEGSEGERFSTTDLVRSMNGMPGRVLSDQVQDIQMQWPIRAR